MVLLGSGAAAKREIDMQHDKVDLGADAKHEDEKMPSCLMERKVRGVVVAHASEDHETADPAPTRQNPPSSPKSSFVADSILEGCLQQITSTTIEGKRFSVPRFVALDATGAFLVLFEDCASALAREMKRYKPPRHISVSGPPREAPTVKPAFATNGKEWCMTSVVTLEEAISCSLDLPMTRVWR